MTFLNLGIGPTDLNHQLTGCHGTTKAQRGFLKGIAAIDEWIRDAAKPPENLQPGGH